MPQIKVELTDRTEQTRFQDVLAQTIAYADAHATSDDCMVVVSTVRNIDGLTKIISCAAADALEFFLAAFDGQVGHA